ncbi:MAG: NAD-dependent epimerase/dehydratase family protein [Candidatus Dormibacteria bacterium]
MATKRVLITAVSRFWGARLALALEADPQVELVVGIDTREPTVALERTEFVRADIRHSLIGRLIRSLNIDTVVDTHLLVDTALVGSRLAHETNVIGSVNLLAACAGKDSPVRKVVVKSSTVAYGCSPGGPSIWSEDSRNWQPSSDPFVADVVEIEEMTRDFALRNREITVTTLRFVNVLGARLHTPLTRYFGQPVVPTVAGYDPRLQFIEEHDALEVLRRATVEDHPGAFNVTAHGCVLLSQVISLAGRVNAAVLPPYLTQLSRPALGAFGLSVPGHLLDLLKHGRVVDGRRLRETFGLVPRLSTLNAVREWARTASGPRLERRRVASHDRYEPAIEEYLRSRRPGRPARSNGRLGVTT